MGESSLTIQKDFNFKILGSLNVENLKEKIKTIPKEEWEKFEHRKSFFGQENTNCLAIKFNKDVASRVFSFDYENEFLLNFFDKELKDCYEIIKQYYSGQPYRVMITELIANKNIDPHVDAGYHLENTHRIHLCIKTNDDVDFIVNDEKIELKEGLLFEINNQREHAVFNRSSENRLHLIIDWGKENDSYYK